ncbi:Na(+)/Ca(2+) antiporter MaX1 [Intoshia linei]|uniref:Na(+)/Ca(2+) antiporter MaX1 n=1 Tax=Intoshia linei TaxID=1819745 RepID=A0A177B2Z3_9BILA|nr:Na(+)/Ca(2+) antiporter MaX1 [Intoshia linei]
MLKLKAVNSIVQVSDVLRNSLIKGGFLIVVLISLYITSVIVIISKNYFVPTIVKLCKVYNIRDDFAGVTFMAVASSLPQLVATVVGVVVTEDDIGVGTVIGSMFVNTFISIGICAIIASNMNPKMNKNASIRDAILFLISSIAFFIILYDGIIRWFEAAILVLIYIMYILIVIFWNKILKFFKKIIPSDSYSENIQLINNNKSTSTITSNDTTENLESPTDNRKLSKISKLIKLLEYVTFPITGCFKCLKLNIKINEKSEKKETSLNQKNGKKMFWMTALFCIFFSIILIGISSYILIICVTICSNLTNIPTSIIGMTIISIASSLPDLINSIEASNEGHIQMSFSNSLSSNTFDILFSLGLPWFMSSLLHSEIKITENLTFPCSILILAALFILMSLFIKNIVLTKKFGIMCIILYVFIQIICIVYLSIMQN